MTKRRETVELFEQMRREYEHGEGTIKGMVRKFGVHRRMVRQALASAVPPERKKPVRQRPKLWPVAGLIDEILEADRNASRKQRHRAHQIWLWVRQEKPQWKVGESTVRRYVQRRKGDLRLVARRTIQRRCCVRRPLVGVRVADFPGGVYVFTMTDLAVHETDLRVHDQ